MTQTPIRLALVLAASCATFANAGMATITYSLTQPSPAAVSEEPALEDALVYDFFMSTDGDFLVMSLFELQLGSMGTFYQHPLGGDVRSPHRFLVDTFPALEFDSHLTSPGSSTASIVASFPCGSGSAQFRFDENGIGEVCEATVFDLTDEGPLADFHFARFTVIGDGQIVMDGALQTNTPPRIPEFTLFEVRGQGENIVGATFVPEPSGCLVSILMSCAFVLRTRKRRQ